MDQQKLSLNFEGAPLAELVDFLATTTGIAFVIHPDVFKYKKVEELKVDLAVTKLSLRSVLNILTKVKRLQYCLRNGVILIYLPQVTTKEDTTVVATKESVAKTTKMSEQDKANFEKLKKSLVSLDFKEAPLQDFVNYLSENSGISFVIHPKVFDGLANKNDLKIDLTVTKLPLCSILNLLEPLKGLKYRLTNGVILIYKK